jgi:tetratricopeptide (TPR) repeat protein
MAAYLQLANDKDPAKTKQYYVRAINTIERAQAAGIMTDPKSNYNLVSIYIAAEQYSRATDILYTGLKKGTIESTPNNWRILGSYFQQANKDLQALEALTEAAKLFPKEGMLELQIGEIYRGMEKTKEARDRYRLALQKGNLEKPHIAYQLLAFAAMELDDWDEANKAVQEAAKFPEFKSDKQMQNLKEHIESTVKERNEAKKAKQADAKTKTP